MFLKAGEVLQYLLSMAAGNGVARVRLEVSTRPDVVWTSARGSDGSLIDSTGTVAVPLTGTIYSGLITNETGRDAWYRWRAVTYDLVNSNIFDWSLINAIQPASWIDAKAGVCMIVNDNEPTDGVLGDGVGYAEGGSIYIDSVGDPKIWFNNGTSAAPDWDLFA
jgi:hypothetical protein